MRCVLLRLTARRAPQVQVGSGPPALSAWARSSMTAPQLQHAGQPSVLALMSCLVPGSGFRLAG